MGEQKTGSGEILLYDNSEKKEFVSTIFKVENFWLTQKAMVERFGCTPDNILLHLKNIFTEDELNKNSVTEKFSVTAAGASERRAYQKIADVFEQCSYDYDKNSETLEAKNHLNERALSRLNRLVTLFIDYAELMAEHEQLMSMADWLAETDRFLTNNRRNVLEGKGHISHDDAVKKVGGIYAEFRKRQDADYISEFDRKAAKYLKGGDPK